MKRMLKSFFSVAVLLSVTAAQAVVPYYSIRSQSENAARELVNWTNHVNLYDMDKIYGSFSVTPEYTQSFRANQIANCLFGCDLQGDCKCPTINIKGSVIDRNNERDWLAEYFYLPSDYKGTITVNPRIQNFLVDLNWYAGLDEWANGLFFRVHAPITWTKWDLRACCAGKGGAFGIPNALGIVPVSSFNDYACCGATPNDIAVQTGEDGDDPSMTTLKFQGLCCAKICCDNCNDKKKMRKIRLADIQADFGWNFYNEEDYHFGLFVRAAAPTGNRPTGEFLFEPIVGNGKHWELGGGLTSKAILWRSEDEDRNFGFYLDANMTHMFKTRQRRVFDICDKPLSRYMLAGKFNSAGEFTGDIAPVANITCCDVKVSVGIQADVVAMFNYKSDGFGFDLGYNFWGRSCEKIKCYDKCPSTCDSCCRCGCQELDGKTWGLLASTYSEPITTFGTQKNGTIHNLALPLDDPKVFIDKAKHLDYDAARTRGMSHKVFTHFGYTWQDRDDWIPYLGIGGEVEFGKSDKKSSGSTTSSSGSCSSGSCSTTSDPCCDKKCCRDCAVSQWGIWLKGGVSYQ